jgi:peptide/nickel transport system substrate-binding protein
MYELIFETMLRFDEDGRLAPGLIEKWESPDDQTYILKLRQGVKFHNGKPMVAEDVKFSIERLQDSKGGSLHGALYSSIDSMDIIDDHTLKLNLNTVDAGLLNIFASPFQNAVFPKGNIDHKSSPVGTGPFKFVKYTPGVSVSLTRNDNYWNKPLPYLDGIEFLFLPDESARLAAMNAKQIDMTWVPTPAVAAQASQGTDLVLLGKSYNKPVCMYINNTKKPFDDVRVRRALSLALNRQEIVDTVAMGRGSVATTAVPPSDPLWLVPDAGSLPYYKQDVEKAKALLADAGYPNGFEVEIQTSGLATHVMDSELIKGYLEAIGIKAKIAVLESAKRFANLRGRTYQISIGGGRPNADPGAYWYPDFHSANASTSRIGYSDPKLDKLLDDARKTTDVEARRKLYFEIQRQIADQVAMIWPYVLPVRTELVQPYVKGYKGIDKFYGRGTMADVWLDK